MLLLFFLIIYKKLFAQEKNSISINIILYIIINKILSLETEKCFLHPKP